MINKAEFNNFNRTILKNNLKMIFNIKIKHNKKIMASQIVGIFYKFTIKINKLVKTIILYKIKTLFSKKRKKIQYKITIILQLKKMKNFNKINKIHQKTENRQVFKTIKANFKKDQRIIQKVLK